MSSLRNADGPNHKTHRDHALDNSTDASFCRLCAAHCDGLTLGKTTKVDIALKPHLDKFFQFPTSSTLSVNVSVEVRIQDICGYVSESLYSDSSGRHFSNMHSLYAVSVTNELIALPDMTVKDALNITRKSAARNELYYAPREMP
ncbi:hypothetical protein MRX96_032356 [Rhipicephalus microplus]